MPSLRTKTMSTVLAVTAVVATGCGSSGPSKASYVAKANAICATYNAKGKAIPQPNSAGGVKAAAGYLDQVVGVMSDETGKLKALKTPKGDGQKLASIYSQQQAQVTKLKAAVTQLNSGNASAASSAIDQLTSGNPAVDSAFDSYGLTTCGSNS